MVLSAIHLLLSLIAGALLGVVFGLVLALAFGLRIAVAGMEPMWQPLAAGGSR
jgi:hypothetical protein